MFLWNRLSFLGKKKDGVLNSDPSWIFTRKLPFLTNYIFFSPFLSLWLKEENAVLKFSEQGGTPQNVAPSSSLTANLRSLSKGDSPVTSPFQNYSSIHSQSRSTSSPSLHSRSPSISNMAALRWGSTMGIFLFYQDRPRKTYPFWNFLSFEGFKIFIQPLDSFGEDGHYSSCVSKTRRSTMLPVFNESYLEAACVCRKLSYLICAKWQQFDEYWLQKYFDAFLSSFELAFLLFSCLFSRYWYTNIVLLVCICEHTGA